MFNLLKVLKKTAATSGSYAYVVIEVPIFLQSSSVTWFLLILLLFYAGCFQVCMFLENVCIFVCDY